jgi:hypothetical protein
MEVCLNGLHVQVRPPGEQCGCPVITTPIVHVVREFRPMGRDPNFPVGMLKERRATAEGTMELTTKPESPMMLQR